MCGGVYKDGSICGPRYFCSSTGSGSPMINHSSVLGCISARGCKDTQNRLYYPGGYGNSDDDTNTIAFHTSWSAMIYNPNVDTEKYGYTYHDRLGRSASGGLWNIINSGTKTSCPQMNGSRCCIGSVSTHTKISYTYTGSSFSANGCFTTRGCSQKK